MGIWNQANGILHISNHKSNTWRIVEDQSKSTTRKFVDSSEEHDLLEKLLETSKPKIKYYGDEVYFKGLHYLLSTPFRYPPLRWGSRFGSILERGILYTSLDLTTAMSEVAFYKLAFLRASESKIGGKTISYTSFKINVESEKFINLHKDPFNHFEEHISSKISYQKTRKLGEEMRNNKIECFQYKSARNIELGFNVGVFSPKALLNNNKIEKTFEPLNCYATKDGVEFSFKYRRDHTTKAFPLEMFLVNGKMPLPTI